MPSYLQPSVPTDSTSKRCSELPTKNRRRSNLAAVDAPGMPQRDQMLPNPFFRLGLTLPLHPLGSGSLGANLSLCFCCRPVSLIRRLCSLLKLLHVIFGLSAHPCRPHGRFPSGLNAGNGGPSPRLSDSFFPVPVFFPFLSHLLSTTCCLECWATMTHSQAGSWCFFGPHWSVGNRLIAVLQCLLDPKTCSPAEVRGGLAVFLEDRRRTPAFQLSRPTASWPECVSVKALPLCSHFIH